MDILRSLGSIVSTPLNLISSSLQTIYDDQFSHPCTTGMGVNQAYLAISGIALGTLGLYGLGKVSSSISFKASLFLISAGGLLLVQSAVKYSFEISLSMLITGCAILQLRSLYLQSEINALQQQQVQLALQQQLQQQQAQLALQLLNAAPSPQSPKQSEDISAHIG